jgi:hypothetical protein
MKTRLETGNRLHSVESAAELLGGLSPSAIRSRITQGRLQRVKIGRLTRDWESDLLAMVSGEQTVEAATR